MENRDKKLLAKGLLAAIEFSAQIEQLLTEEEKALLEQRSLIVETEFSRIGHLYPNGVIPDEIRDGINEAATELVPGVGNVIDKIIRLEDDFRSNDARGGLQ